MKRFITWKVNLDKWLRGVIFSSGTTNNSISDWIMRIQSVICHLSTTFFDFNICNTWKLIERRGSAHVVQTYDITAVCNTSAALYNLWSSTFRVIFCLWKTPLGNFLSSNQLKNKCFTRKNLNCGALDSVSNPSIQSHQLKLQGSSSVKPFILQKGSTMNWYLNLIIPKRFV